MCLCRMSYFELNFIVLGEKYADGLSRDITTDVLNININVILHYINVNV